MANGEDIFLQLKGFNSTWKELQKEKDFCDATLACDDKQIQVHKVIISSCSSVLRNILKLSSHQTPLIFLRGVYR